MRGWQSKLYAGVAQLVERNLAKVEVASSRLVSRSNPQREATLPFLFGLNRRAAAAAAECGYNPAARHLAGWQSGYAAACKAVYAGSIPTSASSCKQNGAFWRRFCFPGPAAPPGRGGHVTLLLSYAFRGAPRPGSRGSKSIAIPDP
ncbi:hypothetical protein CBM2637_A170525 [Cupriavidus taiwanensis]|nr:hypothetical protein CBM2637_A170525 [Cupriavidus taiwanensis]